MLGIPYEGRGLDYGAPAAPPGPVAPEVAAGRDLRREQDDAYQASLRARDHAPQRPFVCLCTLQLSDAVHVKAIQGEGALRQAPRAGARVRPARRNMDALLQKLLSKGTACVLAGRP